MSQVIVPSAAVAIITNEEASHFLLQRKDNRHPVSECRQKLSLFGGSVENGETPHDAIVREIGEEIIDREVARSIVSHMRFFLCYPELPRRQRPGIFDCHIFVSIGSNIAFREWVTTCMRTDVVVEGEPVLVSRAELDRALLDPELFIASLDEPLRDWLAMLGVR